MWPPFHSFSHMQQCAYNKSQVVRAAFDISPHWLSAMLPHRVLMFGGACAQAAHYVLRGGEERAPSGSAFASLASSLYARPSSGLPPRLSAT